MKPITLNVWVDPETHKASENPVRIEFSNVESLQKLRDSGFRFEIDKPETSSEDRDNYSYCGKCCYCEDLIRKEIELDFFSENDQLGTFHRECLELYMLGARNEAL